jgi:hypothetical protein
MALFAAQSLPEWYVTLAKKRHASLSPNETEFLFAAKKLVHQPLLIEMYIPLALSKCRQWFSYSTILGCDGLRPALAA